MVIIVHDWSFDFHSTVGSHLRCDESLQETFHHSPFWIPAKVAWVAAFFIICYFKLLHDRYMWWHLRDRSNFRDLVFAEFFEIFVSFEVEFVDRHKCAIRLENMPSRFE